MTLFEIVVACAPYGFGMAVVVVMMLALLPLREKESGRPELGGTRSRSSASRAGRQPDSKSAAVKASFPDGDFTQALFHVGALIFVPLFLSLLGVGVGFVAATLILLVFD